MDFNVIRKKIIVFLAERNLNQTWLANQLNSDQPLISQWLSGKRIPRKSNIAKIMLLLKEHGVEFNSNTFEFAEDTNLKYTSSSSQIPSSDLIQIPILSSIKNLNLNNLNNNYVAGSIYYPRYEIATEYPEVQFAIKMKSNAMEPYILQGSTCFISPTNELSSGKTMLLYNTTNDEYLIGKVAFIENQYFLTFTHQSASALKINKPAIEVVGEVKACINKIF